MSEILLPPVSAEKKDDYKQAINAISKVMDVEITVEEVTSLRVKWPNVRGDVSIVINDLAGIKQRKKYKRGPDIQVGKGSAENFPIDDPRD